MPAAWKLLFSWCRSRASLPLRTVRLQVAARTCRFPSMTEELTRDEPHSSGLTERFLWTRGGIAGTVYEDHRRHGDADGRLREREEPVEARGARGDDGVCPLDRSPLTRTDCRRASGSTSGSTQSELTSIASPRARNPDCRGAAVRGAGAGPGRRSPRKRPPSGSRSRSVSRLSPPKASATRGSNVPAERRRSRRSAAISRSVSSSSCSRCSSRTSGTSNE